MAHLFSPLTIARMRLPNRIVLAPLPSGFTAPDGFIDDTLITYYVQRAQGGVGLIITEAALVVPPPEADLLAHLGLYADVFIPQLHRLSRAIHHNNARLMLLLEAPAAATQVDASGLRLLGDRFIQAAWRALLAGCDGVILSAADGGALHMLVSPRFNRRIDVYGGTLDGRLRLPIEIIDGIRSWFGKRLVLGFRLVADEFQPDGITLQDARVIAKRVVGAGAGLLDVTAATGNAVVARFPGWQIPLVSAIKRVNQDVPVIGAGLLGDSQLADSVVRDGSVDLVMLGQALRNDPAWPNAARAALNNSDNRAVDAPPVGLGEEDTP